MATITLDKQRFLGLIGKRLSYEELEESLPQIKCEVEGITESELTLSVTGDRPDLLSGAGVARALKGSLEIDLQPPELKVEKSNYSIAIDKSVEAVRPFLVSAFVEGLKLDSTAIKELMQLQEKLHITQGRKRKKVAVGLHNADVLKFPLTYKAVEPKSISFIPLGTDIRLNLEEVLRQHDKGIEYADILKGKEKYPVIIDSSDNIASFPPIINGKLTEVTEKTKNVLVDITGTDLKECELVLQIICQDLQDMGGKVKSVLVNGVDFTQVKKKSLKLNVEKCNKTLGLKLQPSEIIKALYKQRIAAEEVDNDIIAFLPNYRNDLFAEIDLVEEVAIGHGFKHFTPIPPTVFTVGKRSERSKEMQKTAVKMIGSSFIEANNYIVTTKQKQEKAGLDAGIVEIVNPVSEEYTAVRSSILHNLLEILQKNTHLSYPQKLFELGEVVEVDDKNLETKTKTRIKLAATSCHADASMSEIASILQTLFKEKLELKKPEKELKTLISGRAAEVFVNGKKIGFVGEVSPQTLENYSIEMPCACFETYLTI